MAEIALVKRVKYAVDVYKRLLEGGFDIDNAVLFLEGIPDADVAPVVHGRWLGWGKGGTPTYENYGTCSICGEDAEIYTGHRNYCPNCGAKMDERMSDNA